MSRSRSRKSGDRSREGRSSEDRPGLPAWVITYTVCLLSGCVQEMADEPRYEPYEASVLFPNGTSARPIPVGTVPRSGLSRRGTAEYDPPYETGYESGRPLEDLPERVKARYDLPALLARGQERFTIYCAPCHGLAGDGDGMVPRRGFPFPPSYHTDRLRAVPVGYIYSVATVGHGRMPSYAAQTPSDDRWAIAAYVRALQLGRHVPASDLPETDRRRLPGGTP